MESTQLALTEPVEDSLVLRLAIAAYLARYKGQSRTHAETDLRSFTGWAADHGLHPLKAKRAHIELYLRWLQEVRRYKPSTVSRRLSILAGFYRICVIDEVLEHSPAEYVRRPHVPPESPTLGLNHLQFEAILCASRDSTNPNDFALVAMLGLLGLRIFEATGANIEALGESHGHRSCASTAKATRSSWSHSHPLWPERSTVPSASASAEPSCAAAPVTGWTATAPPAASAPSRGSPRDHRADASPHAPTHLRHDDARRRRRPARRPDRSETCRPQNNDAIRPSSPQPRPAPQLRARRIHGVWNLNSPAASPTATRSTGGSNQHPHRR
ncbi:hypothetical protein BH09ACT11_BH09ACT11_13040 [soil metagenome]